MFFCVWRAVGQDLNKGVVAADVRTSLEERLELVEARLREDDELSIVELMASSVSRFVSGKLLPRSDPECKWHYAKAVCVPKCECELRWKPGDLTPSRACRRRRSESLSIDDCDSDLNKEPGLLVKVGQGAKAAAFATADFLDEAAPPSDPTCDWSWSRFSCTPGCVLAYRFGDFHIGRSCRRLATPDDILREAKREQRTTTPREADHVFPSKIGCDTPNRDDSAVAFDTWQIQNPISQPSQTVAHTPRTDCLEDHRQRSPTPLPQHHVSRRPLQQSGSGPAEPESTA